MYGTYKLAGFFSLLGGVLVVVGKYASSLGKYQLILIGAILAAIAGLISIFKRTF